MIELFNASSKSKLGIGSEFLCIQKDDGFEFVVDVLFREEFEIFTDELDSFSDDAVDVHDASFHVFFFIKTLDEVSYQGLFTASMRSMENNVRDALFLDEDIEFVHMCIRINIGLNSNVWKSQI